MARFTFEGDAGTFGLMFAVLGVGAVIGGLSSASSDLTGRGRLPIVTALFAISMGAVALSPSLWVAMLALALVGGAATSFLIEGSTMLQLIASPDMRGRVLAQRAIAFFGMGPVGAPSVGWVGEHLGPRPSVAIGAVVAGACARGREDGSATWANLKRVFWVSAALWSITLPKVSKRNT